jgi:uncharacterized membrane protein
MKILILISAFGSALVAGLFFAFSNFVMAALGRLAPPQGIAAMQSINITVINPVFFVLFFGTALAAAALAILSLANFSDPRALKAVQGAALYLFGVIGVTMFANVPLNNALAAVDPGSAQGAEVWTRYLANWTFWNHVRCVASAAAAVLFASAAAAVLLALAAG